MQESKKKHLIICTLIKQRIKIIVQCSKKIIKGTVWIVTVRLRWQICVLVESNKSLWLKKSQTFSGDLSKKSGEIFFRYFFSKNQRKVMPVSAKADPTPWRALAKNSIL